MSLFTERNHDLSVGDADRPTVLQELGKQRFRREMRVAGQLLSEESQEIIGQEGHSEIEVDFNDHGGRHSIEMEKLNLLRDIF